MDLITIKDKKKQLTFALDDLKAISSIILTVGDHEEYANAYEALKVIDRALTYFIVNIIVCGAVIFAGFFIGTLLTGGFW